MSDLTPRPRSLIADVELLFAALSRLYRKNGKREELEVIANSQIRPEEGYVYDNWNGGQHGHALYLTLPQEIFLNLLSRKNKLQESICTDLNTLHNFEDEHIAKVFIELGKAEDTDWRLESGALRTPQRSPPKETLTRLWGSEGYRVFLSHKAMVKEKAGYLRDSLMLFGVSAFVAHDCIKPTKAWQDEIESALASADAFVALLTEDFHESDWCDQEVGFALGRGIPLICVKLGRDPYGFIGRFQALPCEWREAPAEITKLLVKEQRMLQAYLSALRNCGNFRDGLALAQVLPAIETLTPADADSAAEAFNRNPQLRDCWAFRGDKPSVHGPGLAYHLTRATGQVFVLDSSGQIARGGK